MAKKIITVIKLQIPGGKANPAPPVGPALAGPAGAQRGSAVSGTVRFVQESIAELKKVDWPKQPQVIQGTGVVLFACLVVGVFLYVSDQAFKALVENVFLGQ